MMRATATDEEFRVRVACRRSSKLSPSLSSAGPDPLSKPSPDPEKACSSAVGDESEGALMSEEVEECSILEDCVLDSSPLLHLSPIPEELGMSEASFSSIFGPSTLSPVTVVLLCQDAIVAGGHLQASSLASPCLGVGVGGLVAQVGEDSREAFGAVDGLLVVDGDRDGVELAVGHGVGHSAVDGVAPSSAGSYGVASAAVLMTGDGVVLGGGGRGVDSGGAQIASEDKIGDVLAPTLNSGEALCRDPSLLCSNVFLSSSDDVQNGEGLEIASCSGVVKLHRAVALLGSDARPVEDFLHADEARPGTVVPSVDFAESRAVVLLPRIRDVVGHCDGGTVREEDGVLPMTRGAVRPQPADGLRQPLSSPVELVSVVEGGV
ncbi:hypothetical protein Dimus_003433, partial [Dionaea muscipula]